MSNQQRRPYLDKICSGPHLMGQRPGIREDTIVLIPPLKHTGIKSDLQEQEIPVTNPEGRITYHYKHQSKKRLQPIYRDHQELSHREITFKKGHKQFIDKVLMDMEEKKRNQYERQMKHWKSSKSTIGFDNSFNGLNLSEFRKDFEDNNKTNDLGEKSKTASAVTAEEDEYGADGDFEIPQEENERKSTEEKKELTIDAPGTLPLISPKRPSPKRSGSIISNTSSNSQGASPTRRSRPFSRMSLFENMLENMEPPQSPSKRFGSLADITAVFRESFIIPQQIPPSSQPSSP